MIDWIKYDPYSDNIEPNTNHIVTDGKDTWIAHYDKNARRSGWYFGRWFIDATITHWAKINLPGEDTDGTSK